MLKNFKKNNNKGFTLVELLVVIAIIGILAVVAVPSLFKNINKANAADVVADISAIKTAVVAEYADKGAFTPGTYTTEKLSTVTEGSKAGDLASTFGVEDLSNSADYELTVTAHDAKLKVTAKNKEIAAMAMEKLDAGTVTDGTANDNIFTVQLIGTSVANEEK